MEKRRKKLNLHRETLQALASREIREVAGGATFRDVVCGSGVPICGITRISYCPCN